MKLARVLILTLGLVMVAAIPSLANVPFTTSSTLNQMAPNAETGLAGNIVMTALAGGNVAASEIINMAFSPSVISSLTDATATVTLGGVATALPLALVPYATPQAIVAGITVTINPSNIVFTFPAGGVTAFAANTDNIQISGLRLDVHTFATVGSTLNVTISSVLGSATVTNPTVPVALFVEPITVTETGTLTYLEYFTGTVNSTATVAIAEAGSFTNAFETQGPVAPTKVILQVTGLPTGIALTGAVVNALPAGLVVVLDATQSPALYAAGTVILDITAQNANLLDTFSVTLTFSSSAGMLALNPPPASISATLAPAALVPPLYDVENLVGDSDLYAPRLKSANIPITITQLATALLSVFNAWLPGDFDTGFAIANTTGYVVTPVNIAGENVLGQTGNIIVVLYPQGGGTPYVYTTGPSNIIGTGLDSSGNLDPQGTWTVLLSALAQKGGFTSFVGQVMFFTNFSDAHGVNFVSDPNFAVHSEGYPMLVLPLARNTFGDFGPGAGE